LKIRTPARFGLVAPNGEPVQRTKVDVGTPMGGSVTRAFHVSQLALQNYEMLKGFHAVAVPQSGYRKLLADIYSASSLYVGANRGQLVETFMKGDSDWLLQIDTDIEFPPTLLETLIDLAGSDRKMIAASVPLGSDYPTCAFMRTEYPGVWRPLPRFDGVIECDGVATAVMMAHRSVFEAVEEKFGQSWFHHMDVPRSEKKYLVQGEDMAFSLKATECGVRIYCANIPGLRHHKTIALSHDAVSLDPGVGKRVEVEVAEERPA
jgi:hypothetical protein